MMISDEAMEIIVRNAMAAGREVERKRCAKIAESLSEKPGWSPNYKRAAKVIADMIRSGHQ